MATALNEKETLIKRKSLGC